MSGQRSTVTGPLGVMKPPLVIGPRLPTGIIIIAGLGGVLPVGAKAEPVFSMARHKERKEHMHECLFF